MPSVSKKQRRFMGMKYAEAEAGHNTTGMSIEQLHDFAATKEKGLPEKKRRAPGLSYGKH